MRKTIPKLLAIAAVALIATAATLTYHLSSATPMQLIVYMHPDDSNWALRWGARQALYWEPLAPESVTRLDREAGAQYAALFPDRQEAESMLEHFLVSGVDINSRDERGGHGATALHVAALAGETDRVELLLEYGADPTVENAAGDTPLELVQQSRYSDTDEDLRAIIALLQQAAPG